MFAVILLLLLTHNHAFASAEEVDEAREAARAVNKVFEQINCVGEYIESLINFVAAPTPENLTEFANTDNAIRTWRDK